MSNKKFVVGNWKMNPGTLDEAKRIARKARQTAARLDHTEVVVCPPFPYISAIMPRGGVAHYHLGAQSASFETTGAHTGEVSAVMLDNIGVEYVIVGHSETRKNEEGSTKEEGSMENVNGDSNEIVSKRIKAVLEAGMTAILCVGEKVRDESGAHFDFIKEQLKKSLENVSKSNSAKIIVAYEPIWTIGAKEAMKPEDIREMAIFVKKVFSDIFGVASAEKTLVLYGGSVNAANAAQIITIGQVDGLLVGRESINLTGFSELLKAVDGVK